MKEATPNHPNVYLGLLSNFSKLSNVLFQTLETKKKRSRSSLRIFQSLPGSRLRHFCRDTGSVLSYLVNQCLEFIEIYSY